MNFVSQLNGNWYAEQVLLSSIAKTVGTPFYLYSKSLLQKQWLSFEWAFNLNKVPHQVYYAVKANSNLAILDLFNRLGSGFDIVSAGELQRVLHIKANPQKIIFSGVGKTTEELKLAVNNNIGCIHLESSDEIIRLNDLGKNLKKIVPISLRINPNVNADSHPYISTGRAENKFGIPIEEAIAHYQLVKTLSHLNIKGIAFHIGSQITTLEPFVSALNKILNLITTLKKMAFLFLLSMSVVV